MSLDLSTLAYVCHLISEGAREAVFPDVAPVDVVGDADAIPAGDTVWIEPVFIPRSLLRGHVVREIRAISRKATEEAMGRAARGIARGGCRPGRVRVTRSGDARAADRDGFVHYVSVEIER